MSGHRCFGIVALWRCTADLKRQQLLYKFPLHTLEIGPQISYYILDIDSNTIKTCKCKCNQDGNSFRNNLRVRVNLVHPTLGGA